MIVAHLICLCLCASSFGRVQCEQAATGKNLNLVHPRRIQDSEDQPADQKSGKESLESARLSCEERRARGPDKSPFDVFMLVFSHLQGPWMWTMFVLCMLGPVLYCAVHQCQQKGLLQEDTRGHGRITDADDVKDLVQETCERILHCAVRGLAKLLTLGFVLIFSLSLLLPFGLTVFLFPVLAKFKVWHMQDAIGHCLSLPSSEVVPLSQYVAPVYVILILMGLKDFWYSKWVSPSQQVFFGYTAREKWLFDQCRDAYTDLASLLAIYGHVPGYYFTLWLVTCSFSIGLLVRELIRKGPTDNNSFFNLLGFQLVGEDIPQFLLAAAGIFNSALAIEVNQYMLYGSIQNAIGIFILAKRLFPILYAKLRSEEPIYTLVENEDSTTDEARESSATAS